MEQHIYKEIKTPCYIIDLDVLTKNIEEMRLAFKEKWGNNLILGYSVKTNRLPFLLTFAKEKGFYAEVVSGDEYNFAILQGYLPSQIIYNGPQKDEKTIIQALNQGSIVNIDHLEEINILEKNKHLIDKEQCHLGLRVNFDLENYCKGETTAGDEVSRFGLSVENGDFKKAIKKIEQLNLKVEGLHMHYSSKSRSINIFKTLAWEAVQLVKHYHLKGLKFIDIGGGFWGGQPLENKPSMNDYSRTIVAELEKAFPLKDIKLILEPGASILASSIDYVTKVINIRDIRDTRVVTLDGSNLHINPFMVKREPKFKADINSRKQMRKQILCGSTCMENDRLLNLKNYYEFHKDDIITFKYAGAYTMAFNSAFINVPPAIYVKEGSIIRLLRKSDVNIMALI